MNTTTNETYDKIANAIGRVSLTWAWIETQLTLLISELSTRIDQRFADDSLRKLLEIVVTNTDLREKITVAKVLAHLCHSPLVSYELLEPLLNEIDGDLRTERNRFIHDMWSPDGDSIIRMQEGARLIKQPGSGVLEFAWRKSRPYKDASEIEAFVNQLFLASAKLGIVLNALIQDTEQLKHQSGSARQEPSAP